MRFERSRKGNSGEDDAGMTHDYKRNGTTTLFAALEILQGKVIGECQEKTAIRSS
jgi:hypothetical protein